MTTDANPQSPPPDVSVVVPLRDEEETLHELHTRLAAVFEKLGRTFEIVFVDDGSRDGSLAVLEELHAADPRLHVIGFRRNFGKAAALSAGFNAARGAIVITLDADLQDDPAEIPRFLERIEEGWDLVSGWKRVRHDPLSKTLPSLLFNRVTSWATGLAIHDSNCGFKAYRREVIEEIELYGDLHRFIPALAAWKGFRVGEIEVLHHPRRHGRSKYGWERMARGFFDLLTIILLTRFSRRPLHLFGTVGLLFCLLGGIGLGYLSVLWFAGERPIGTRPLLTFSTLSVIMGVQLVSIGLVSEMLTRLEYRSGEPYSVKCELPSAGRKDAEPATSQGSRP